MRGVEGGVRFGKGAVLGLKVFKLLFEVLDVLFFALAEGALRGAILSSTALQTRVSFFDRGKGQLITYDAHIGDGFLVLSSS